MTNKQLHKYILATVAYYDGLLYPMTAFEIWKYLIRIDYSVNIEKAENAKLADVMRELQSDFLLKHLDSAGGFYFLKGQQQLVSRRIKGQKISAGKLKKLYWVVWCLKFVPFVRMVGVTGGLAMKNAHAKSDWDLFIVIAAGHIWTGRTLVTMITQLLGKRRYGKKIINRACLNYFVTDSSLEVMTKDLFSANEYMFLVPLFGMDVFHRFQIKNRWIKNMKPNYYLQQLPHPKMIEKSFFSRAVQRFGEFLFRSSWLEQMLKKIEKKKILANPKTFQEGSLVYAEDDALIFLPKPHGPAVFEKFKEKIEQVGLSR